MPPEWSMNHTSCARIDSGNLGGYQLANPRKPLRNLRSFAISLQKAPHGVSVPGSSPSSCRAARPGAIAPTPSRFRESRQLIGRSFQFAAWVAIAIRVSPTFFALSMTPTSRFVATSPSARMTIWVSLSFAKTA